MEYMAMSVTYTTSTAAAEPARQTADASDRQLERRIVSAGIYVAVYAVIHKVSQESNNE